MSNVISQKNRPFNEDNRPQGKRTPEQQALYDRQTVTFYDIDKKGWRSMRIDTIWNSKRDETNMIGAKQNYRRV